MLETCIDRIAEMQSWRLMGESETIPFGRVLNQKLPSYLMGTIKLMYDPQLGGRIQVGDSVFNFKSDTTDSQQLAQLKEKLQSGLTLSVSEMQELVKKALNTRFNFLIHPAGAAIEALFSRSDGRTVNARVFRASLINLSKLLNQWDPPTSSAIMIVSPYLHGMGDQEIDKESLIQLLQSTLEKELSINPLSEIERVIGEIKKLLNEDPDNGDISQIDSFNPVSEILKNRGLNSWLAAIEVEKDMNDGLLNLDSALQALRRLRLYRELKLLDEEMEDLQVVEEELDDFTQFIEEITQE
ncbi:MAG: hypothetical protein P9L92_15690 [Candidatus Electryonea clarkiae]|nr:hypothetical protein [Candidatus Electryonea clarkiae]MDP8287267.1 hypothetical protein [Candidatus Electryonea clarkiae]